jgi:hypothetical protein
MCQQVVAFDHTVSPQRVAKVARRGTMRGLAWLSGKPDDSDNNESGAEQCASIRTNGTWDDDACNTSLDFFCERP